LSNMRPAITVAALALVMAACGGGDDTQGVASLQDPDSTTTTTTGGAGDEGDGSAVDSEQALLEFAECMREHGIDMEDPSISGEGGGFIRIGPPPGAGGDGSDNDFEAMEELGMVRLYAGHPAPPATSTSSTRQASR